MPHPRDDPYENLTVADFESLMIAFDALEEIGPFTKEDFTNMLESKNPRESSIRLKRLEKEGILREENEQYYFTSRGLRLVSNI